MQQQYQLTVELIFGLFGMQERLAYLGGGMKIRTHRCRVLIVDDHKIMREGLAGLLQFQPEIEIVGEAADGPQAIELARAVDPDVIIMDVNLGGMSGIEAARRILAKIRVLGSSGSPCTRIPASLRPYAPPIT